MAHNEKIDAYINSITGNAHDWIHELVFFLRENYPHAKEEMYNGVPTFEFGHAFIGFAAKGACVAFYSDAADALDTMQLLIANSQLQNNCLLVPHAQYNDLWTLLDAIRDIAKQPAMK